MKKATALEKATGSLPVVGGMAMAAAAAGGPLAALLPVLSGSIAASRQLKRVEKAVEQIESELYNLGDMVQEISDAQYKYVNESLITIMHTPNDEKIEYLIHGVRSAVSDQQLTMHKAMIIARALHGITVEELRFMLKTIGKKIVFNDKNYGSDYFPVSKADDSGEYTTGLASLGLLSRESEGLVSDIGAYSYTPLAFDLVTYISEPA